MGPKEQATRHPIITSLSHHSLYHVKHSPAKSADNTFGHVIFCHGFLSQCTIYVYCGHCVSVEPHFTYLVLTPENEIEPARKSP